MEVTIITPCHNSSRFIEETIKSVQSQTFKDWEMVITDDLSKDNSAEIIEKYAATDDRIKLIKLTKNVGAAEARNIGLRAAKGRYIAFLDSDDKWDPEKLEETASIYEEKDVAFSYTDYRVINVDGSETGRTIKALKVIGYKGYMANTLIGCLTVMIDKEKTGYFEMPIIRSSHDMALWLLIMRRGFKAYGLNKCLASYRLVPNSNTAGKWKAAKDVWKVYREIEKYQHNPSAFYFCSYAFNALMRRM
jgi:teichuronic acid biosynthesis glycosyltransferase TuaG